jgi:hypothetical protein
MHVPQELLGISSYQTRLPPVRGYTAPTQAQRNLQSRSTRVGTGAPGARRGKLGSQHFQGLTLDQFNFGDERQHASKPAFNPMATKSVGLFSDYGKPRQAATAPAWRKTRAARVDEKIGKIKMMFTGADDGEVPALMSESQRREKIMAHYFPGKDRPLGVLPDDEDQY